MQSPLESWALALVDVEVDLLVGHCKHSVLSCACLYLPPGHVTHVPLSENLPDGHVLCRHCSRAVVPVLAVHMCVGHDVQLAELTPQVSW